MTPPDELRTRETSDEHLPGYAELAPANPDPDTLSQALQEQATGPDQVERAFVLGLQWSAAMHDGLAWAAFATYGTRRRADFQHRSTPRSMPARRTRSASSGTCRSSSRENPPMPARTATRHKRIKDCG
jgi:hypothetical protein